MTPENKSENKSIKNSHIFQIWLPEAIDLQLRIFMVAHGHRSKNDALINIVDHATRGLEITKTED